MDFLRAFILGVVQAFTEFLPISSSAHLILFRNWLGFDSIDGITFDVALHIGTVIALIGYFRREVRDLSRGFGRFLLRRAPGGDPWQRLSVYIVVATIPAALAGGLFAAQIDAIFRNPRVIVVTLVLGGVLFLLVERRARQSGTIAGLTLPQCFWIGVAQSIALIPGVSRSGITIIAGMSLGLRRTEAARFSFLLSIPVMLAAGAKSAIDVRAVDLTANQFAVIALGAAASAVFGWIVIRYLLRFLQGHRLDAFAYYRFALATAIVIWLFGR